MTINALNFLADVKRSQAEDVRRINYQILLRHFPVKSFDAVELNGEMNPNDVIIILINGEKKRVEFKNYFDHKNFNFVCLEQYSNNEMKTLGWTFKIDSDFVIFLWHGKKKDCYLIVYGNKLCEWWKINHKNYQIIYNKPSYNPKTGGTWQSCFSLVPVSDLLKEMIFVREVFCDMHDFWVKNGRGVADV